MNELSTVPDALIPHLITTMEMNWRNPADHVFSLANSMPRATTRPRALARHLIRRVGAEAVSVADTFHAAGRAVSFAAMADLQAAILGVASAEFRSTVAYTSVRPERYAYFCGIESMFARKVAADATDSIEPALKPIRLYLDILFFHPFEDGNARAAMMWFVVLCWRLDLPLPNFERLHRFPLRPGNQPNYWAFTEFVLKEMARDQ